MRPRAVPAGIRLRGLVHPEERGVVALSGGGDSLCLLHALSRRQQELGVVFHAAHVDHRLRPGSAAEARQARALGEGLGVDVVLLQAAIDGGCGNLQERARVERHRLLTEHARECGAHWLALGHTATDQAELVLMRAVRGTGPTGLAGMAWSEELEGGPRLVRPLLGVRREQVEEYLRCHGLRPVLDPTNATDAYFRNRVRNQVLPLLRRENPRVVDALCRLAQVCREESDALDRLAADILRRSVTGHSVSVASLGALPTGLLHRVLRMAHRESVGALRGLERSHVEAMSRLLHDAEGCQGVDLPGARVERRYGSLVWVRGGAGTPTIAPITIAAPGRHPLADGRVAHLTLEQSWENRHPRDLLCSRRLSFPLTLRSVESGDRIAIGQGHHRKISRVLMDARVPASLRGSVPLLLCASEVVMVLGHRRAAGWAPEPGGPALVVRLAEA